MLFESLIFVFMTPSFSVSPHFTDTFLKSVVIFKITSADFKVLISEKMTTLLKEMRIAQLSSQNERTLVSFNSYTGSLLLKCTK